MEGIKVNQHQIWTMAFRPIGMEGYFLSDTYKI